MTETLIEVAGLTHRFRGAPVLMEVSLRVERGDFLALIGPNGSGKSTLVKLMLGLLPVQEGSVRLLGEDPRAFRRWEQVGYIPQRAEAERRFPASVREVAGMGRLAGKRFPRWMNRSDRAAVEEALALVGMKELGKRRVGELSGGELQRVLIARALASSPALLVLDEPTAGVDAGTQKSFYDLLGHLNRERGITLVLVTHDIGVVTKHVRQVACLNQRLVFHGSHEQFCSHNEFSGWLAGENHVICHNH